MRGAAASGTRDPLVRYGRGRPVLAVGDKGFVSPGRAGRERVVAVAHLSALVVDSDGDTRDRLRHILRHMNVEVLEADAADEGRALAAGRTLHFALIEVNLPRSPGDVLAAELARSGVVPVLMSGSDYGIARARKTPFMLLEKPFATKEAIRAIVLALPSDLP
jgi:DNA-binding NtrC family response regulator